MPKSREGLREPAACTPLCIQYHAYQKSFGKDLSWYHRSYCSTSQIPKEQFLQILHLQVVFSDFIHRCKLKKGISLEPDDDDDDGDDDDDD